jgi:tetratricopeptide (TPR) repeat protein
VNLETILETIRNGDTEKGLEEMEKYSHSANDQEKYDIVEMYQELGRSDKAQPLIEDLLGRYPDEGALLTTAAENAIDLDDEDEAIEWLLEVKESDEEYLRAQLLLADLYQMQGLDEVAEQKLLDALKQSPEEPVLLAAVGDYYLSRGDYAKSIPYLKQAEGTGFKFPDGSLSLRLAEAYSVTGSFEDALSYYEAGLKEHTELHALFGYGYTALQVSDYQLAAEKFEELRNMDKDFVALYPYLVRSYEGLEDHEKALEAAKAGIKEDEYNENLYTEAGKLYMALGNEEEGEKHLKEALALNPAHLEAANALLSMWMEQEEPEAMIDLIDHLYEMGEPDVRFQWYYARAKNLQDEPVEAKEKYEEVYSVYQENEVFLEEYGRLLLELGYRENALKYLEQASAMQPDHTELQLLLEDLRMSE